MVVSYDKFVRWRENQQRKYLQQGHFVVKRDHAHDVDISLTPISYDNGRFAFPKPRVVAPASTALAAHLMQSTTDFQSCWKTRAFQRFKCVDERIRDDILYMSVTPHVHRLRAAQGSRDGELCLSFVDMSWPAQEVIRRGMVIAIDGEGKASLVDHTMKDHCDDWGIDAQALRREAMRIGHPDLERIKQLDYGMCDYSPHTRRFRPCLRTIATP